MDTESRRKYLILMTGIILLLGISADPFELYTESGIQLAYADDKSSDSDDDDDECGDDDDDGSTDNDDNDGYSSDEDDMGYDTTVGSTTGGGDHDDDDDGGDDDDDRCVGGSGMSISKSALLVSGFQTHGSWMIPVLLAALALGIVVARKF